MAQREPDERVTRALRTVTKQLLSEDEWLDEELASMNDMIKLMSAFRAARADTRQRFHDALQDRVGKLST